MAESLGQATVDLIANTGGFEAGMDRAARKMQSVSKEAAYQGNQLEKLVGAIDPVTGALTRLDKQQQQLDAHFKAGRLPIEDYQKFTGILNAQKTATDATVTGFGKLDRQMAANGQTLKQYQNNLRNVPAQFTDIFVSLQGGQAPLTVLLQQGGQLKDMFGGVGSAAKALGGYVLGLVNPVSVAAAAIAAVGVAYYQGSKESTAYNAALAATGNFAGTSADSLASMAQEVSKTTGTVGAAAEVLAQLAASGKIAVGSFDQIAIAALKTQSATGQAASEIVANFVKIAEDPLKAVIKLNEGMNFLTADTYTQIKAFQDQGDAASAAAVANTAYADALNGVSDKVVADLGYIEQAWKLVKDAAKGAYDAALSVGRATPLDAQIAKAQELVDTLAKAKKNAFPGAPSNALREEQAQKDLTDLLVQRDEKARKESSGRIAAQQKSDALEAAQYIDKINDQTQSKAEKRADERAKYLQAIDKLQAGVANGTVQANDPRIAAENIAAGLDAIDEKYKDKKAARAKAYVEDAGAKELDQAKQVYAVLQAQSLTIGAQDGTTQKLGTAAQELIKWEQQIADIKTKGTLTAAQKSLLADESAITAQKQQNASLEAQNALREKAVASAMKLVSLEQQLNDELSNTKAGFDLQLAGIGLGDEARKRLQDDIKIREDYQKKLEQLNRDYRKIKNPTEDDKANYDAQNALIKGKLAERLNIQQDYYNAEDAAQASWVNGALQGISNYLEQANNLASQTRSLVTNAIGGLEDVFVKLATEGKLSFKSLTDSIIADLARIAAKTLVVQPLLNSLTSGGGGVLSGLLGSDAAGGGSSSTDQALGVLDAAGKSISIATSGFGQAVQAGYTAGEGLIGGIQGAFSSGTGYVSDAITSAFATGSSTAASVIAESAATNTGYQLGGSLVSGQAGSATYATATASSSLSSANVVTAAITGFIQGYKANGIKGGVAGAGGAVAGAYAGAQAGSYFGPIGTAVGAVIGTVVGAAFGSSIFGGEYVTKDQGIQIGAENGMLKAANFEFQKKKGGLFSSNKKRTNITALDPGLQKALDDSYTGTVGTVLGLFDALNVELNDGVLDGLNIASTQISTQGKTSDEIQKELVDFFTKLGDAAVGAVDTALGGVGLGSQTVESLTALVNGLFTVNNVLANLNVGIFDVSVSGAYMAEQLAAWAGGLDKFTEAGTAYYDKFFTDVEKADDVLKAVGVQFASVGVGLPATRQGFRDLVEALDITTESGRQLFTTLIGLSGNAAAAYDILEQRASAAAQAQANYYDLFTPEGQKAADTLANVSAQFKALGLALPGSRDGFRQMVASIDQTTEAGKALFASLLGLATNADAAFDIIEARSAAAQQALLSGAATAFSAVQRAINAQKASINDMLQTAQTNVSGLTAVSSDLSSALKALRGDSDSAVKMLRAQAVATVQSALAYARAGGSLVDFSGLQDALDVVGNNNTDVYTTLEEFNRDQAQTAYALDALNKLNGKQLTSAEQTVKTLQDQLTRLDAQLSLSQSLLDGVNGVDTSVLSVVDAIRQMNASILAVLAANGGVAPGGVSSSIDLLYGAILGRSPDEAGKNYWLAEVASGNLRPDQLADAIRNAANETGQLPRFARGTNSWDGGPALMGEFGPELVLPNSNATVYNAQDTARMLNKAGNTNPQTATEISEQARKNDRRWDQLLRYTQYLEQGFINGFPTVAEGSQ